MQQSKEKLSVYYNEKALHESYQAFHDDARVKQYLQDAIDAGMHTVAVTALQNIFIIYSDPRSGLSGKDKWEWFKDASQLHANDESVDLVLSAVQEHTDKLKQEHAPKFH